MSQRIKKMWWQDKSKLTDYVRVGDKVYHLEDAVSLGMLTDEAIPATKKEFNSKSNANKLHR